MYEDDTTLEPYPDEINIIIEKAYEEKKLYAMWEESDARYRLTFATMVEQLEGQNSNDVKVIRVSKGKYCLVLTFVM